MQKIIRIKKALLLKIAWVKRYYKKVRVLKKKNWIKEIKNKKTISLINICKVTLNLLRMTISNMNNV
jgi:hypothetical protein